MVRLSLFHSRSVFLPPVSLLYSSPPLLLRRLRPPGLPNHLKRLLPKLEVARPVLLLPPLPHARDVAPRELGEGHALTGEFEVEGALALGGGDDVEEGALRRTEGQLRRTKLRSEGSPEADEGEGRKGGEGRRRTS